MRPALFDSRFQKRIVALLLRSPQHAKQIAMLLDPKWIENAVLADVAHVARDYVNKYQAPPTKLVIRTECGKDVFASKIVSDLYKLPLREANYVAEHFIDFCRNRAIHTAVVEAAKDVKAERISAEMISRLQKAMALGTDTGDIGVRIKDIATRAPWYLHDKRLDRVVPTGWTPVDEVMDGGLAAGELGVIMGGAKAGKSFYLTNIGYRALSHPPTWARDGCGLKVVHYTLELSAMKTYRRYDKLLAGKKFYKDMRANPERFVEAITKRSGALLHPDSDLLVKQFPNQTMTPSIMRRHLDYVSSQMGWEPDLLLVDYLDEMAPERRLDERRFELSSIASDLRAIAIERNCPLWTATQTSRESFKKEVVRKEDVAEDIGKIRIADAVWSICATPEEYQEGRMRLFAAAMRDAASEVTIDMGFDFDRGVIRAFGRNDPVPVIKQTGDPGMARLDKAAKMLRRTADKSPSRVRHKESV